MQYALAPRTFLFSHYFSTGLRIATGIIGLTFITYAIADLPTAVAVWHEPHGDMTPEQFRKASDRFFDFMDDKDIAVGPIMNGWLLDSQVSTFASYTDANLLN